MDRLVVDKYRKIIDSKKFIKSAARPLDHEWTVLAGVVMHDSSTGKSEVISLATGVKCVPECRLWEYAEAFDDCLHDMHAEVLARRGALKYLVHRLIAGSLSLERLRSSDTVSFHMYSSHAPCGDASMDMLIEGKRSDTAVVSFDSHERAEIDGLLRGRTDFSQRKRLRTKPGRLDSLPTLSLSCTDKMTMWTVLGWQGAQLFRLLGNKSLYFDSIIVGTGFNESALESSINERVSDFADGRHKVRFIRADDEGFDFRKTESRIHPSPVGFVWIAAVDISEILTCSGRKQGAVRNKSTGKYPLKTCSCICRAAMKRDFETLFAKYDQPTTTLSEEYVSRKKQFKQHSLFSDWGNKRLKRSISPRRNC